MQKKGEDAFTQFPGWLGVASIDGGAVIVAQINDDSPFGNEIRAGFTKEFSILSVVLNNAAGTKELSIDPESLVIHFADGHTVHALPFVEIASFALNHPEDWIKKFGGIHRAGPGGQVTDGCAFIPRGTDLDGVIRMTASVNGHDTAIAGKYLSVDEKAERVRIGKENLEQKK